jgi:ATP-dependent exoDNAse (exonuclease V) alpha subunit
LVGKGFHAKSMTSDKAGGLLPVVYICKGAKVMLTANMCVPYGLFNGSMGRVEEIIYNTGDSQKTSLPKVVVPGLITMYRFGSPSPIVIP